MDDLVQALRDEAAVTQSKLLYEAADRIEALEKALRVLLAAWDAKDIWARQAGHDAFDIARAALKEGNNEAQ